MIARKTPHWVRCCARLGDGSPELLDDWVDGERAPSRFFIAQVRRLPPLGGPLWVLSDECEPGLDDREICESYLFDRFSEFGSCSRLL